jgi:hypothetical protein
MHVVLVAHLPEAGLRLTLAAGDGGRKPIDSQHCFEHIIDYIVASTCRSNGGW